MKKQTSRTSITRNGKTYQVKSLSQKNDNTSTEIYQMIDDLYNEARHKAIYAHFKAWLFGFLFVFGYIYITVAGAVVGILGVVSNVGGNFNNFNNFNNLNNTNTTDTGTFLSMNGFQIAITVLGFGITVTKTLLAAFSVEKQSYIQKQAGVKLNAIAREVSVLKSQDFTQEELFKKVDQIHTEIDSLDIHTFQQGIMATDTDNNVSTSTKRNVVATDTNVDTIVDMHSVL